MHENTSMNKTKEIEKVIGLFKNLDTEQSEIVATLFACWNDLLIEREENITDKKIIYEARNHWHLSKQRFGNWRKTLGCAVLKKSIR